MMSLLAVEIRRNMGRRLYRILMILVALGIALGGFLVFLNSSKSQTVVRFTEGPSRAELIDQCVNGTFGDGVPVAPGTPGGSIPSPGSKERIDLCERFVPDPQAQTFVNDDRFHMTAIKDVLLGITPPLVILAWLLGASFIGAEWRANTIGPLLTWEPRRLRVVAAKILATAIVVAATTVAIQTVLSLALLPSALLRGTTEGATVAFARSAIGAGLRSLALVSLASVIGFSIGSMGRNTTAAVGAGFGYLMILEMGFLGGLMPWLRPWLFMGNAIIFVSGSRTFEVAGRTPIQAGFILAGYTAALAAGAITLFRKRDVA